MRTYKKGEQIVDFLDTVTCNGCGTRLVYDGHPEEQWQVDESYHHFKIHFGYLSNHDLECWEFDLCEKCIEGFTESFEVPVNIEGDYL